MKFLDLDTLLDENKKVYVKNNALRSNLLIIVQMEDRSGRKRPLKVPPTRFPICVSTQFSKDMIRESSDLRDALSKGVLVLMDPKEAEESLRSSDAKEELKSYSMSLYADSAPSNAVRDSMQRLKEQATPVVEAADVLAEPTLPDDSVSARVKALVASLGSKEKASKEILVQLKRIRSTLTSADLTYIIRECDKETQVREYAEAVLAELSESPAEPTEY